MLKKHRAAARPRPGERYYLREMARVRQDGLAPATRPTRCPSSLRHSGADSAADKPPYPPPAK